MAFLMLVDPLIRKPDAYTEQLHNEEENEVTEAAGSASPCAARRGRAGSRPSPALRLPHARWGLGRSGVRPLPRAPRPCLLHVAQPPASPPRGLPHAPPGDTGGGPGESPDVWYRAASTTAVARVSLLRCTWRQRGVSQPGQSHGDTRGVVSWLLGAIRLALRWRVCRRGGRHLLSTCSAPARHLLGTCLVQSTARWRRQWGSSVCARGALSRRRVTTRAG